MIKQNRSTEVFKVPYPSLPYSRQKTTKLVSYEQFVNNPLPGGHSRQLSAVLVDGIPVELAAARVDVDLVKAEPAGALPEEAADPEEDDNGESEVRLEKALGIVDAAFRRSDGYEKLQKGGKSVSHGFRVPILQKKEGEKRISIPERSGPKC